ncbi:MAG: flagellar hook assembly protein FlgD [Candidatus Abyssobacteria bacterium SURF_5]|uniref:Basal-body rod modification protein FlgD n=1 Tax=Abyssobacteria bacterium (strain SURF_5) TaxID=2093360 RepID=A0A3A4N6N5_ABYX5|nr:MAG: flagellar hook assembly protein FlgD [Candidatus Abyssubacteria bacterium SURF_5]
MISPAASAPAGGTGYTLSPGTQELGEDDFLSLLITELMNQDPMDPLADRDFIAQVAQLNTLSQTIELNENLVTLQMLEATSLVGKEIEAIGPNGDHVEGTVTGVWFIDSEPWLVIDEELVVDLDYVVRIEEAPVEEDVPDDEAGEE